MVFGDSVGGRGQKSQNGGDVICERPLTDKKSATFFADQTGCLRSTQNEIPAIEFHLSPHCSTFKVEFLSINTHLSAVVVVVVDGLAAEKEILHTYMDRITSRR